MTDEIIISAAPPGKYTFATVSDWKTYDVDFEKVNTLEDVIALLRGMQITVTLQHPVEDRWQPILPYLKERIDSASSEQEGK